MMTAKKTPTIRRMKYIKTSDIENYLKGKQYSSIHVTGTIYGQKKLYGWDKAREIVKSGNFYYAIW